MATDCLEANSMQQIPILEGEGNVNSTAIDQTHNLELNKPEKIMLDEVGPSKKLHRFYFVKFWPYKDPDEASKLSEAEQLIEKLDQERTHMRKESKISRLKWIETCSQLQQLYNRKSSIAYGLEWQKKMLDYLQVVLDKLNFFKIAHKHKGGANKCGRNTQDYQSWMLHGSSNLATEKKLLREIARSQHRLNDLDPRSLLKEYIWWYSSGYIDKSRYTQMLEKMKQIEEKKEKALGDSYEKGKIWNPLSVRKAIEEQIKLVNKISEELKEEQCEVMSTIERLHKDLKAISKETIVYDNQRWEMRKQNDAAQKYILKVRQKFDEMV